MENEEKINFGAVEPERQKYLEGFLFHFSEALSFYEGGERRKGKREIALSLVERIGAYLSLTCSFDPFGEKKSKSEKVYEEIRALLTKEEKEELKKKNAALADKLIAAESAAIRTDFEAMITYIVSYDGEKRAQETLKFFYEQYLIKREQEKIDGFCRRDKRFEEGIATGFIKLDEALEGGLYPGLYVIGAPSSAGKTSFCVQLSDQIAMKGKKVLFFSLEMSEEELFSKSLSRLTYQLDPDPLKRNAKSERKLTGNAFRSAFREEEWNLLHRAAGEYLTKVTPHKSIVESVGEYGVKEIEREVKSFIAVTGEKPVVFIDYLQILKPYAENMTDKQNTDRSVSALKRLCRDEGITVFVISSFNRSSYHQLAGLEAFKESGAIEYSADAVFSLQADGVKVAAETDKKAQTENKELMNRVKKMKLRPMVLSVLKNRRGRCGEEILFEYNCVFGLFKEIGRKDEQEKTVL